MNFLNISPVSQVPPVLRHFSSQIPGQQQVQGKAQVLAKNLESGNWEGPDPLITWGRGYVCVSTGHGPRRLPARCVRPHLRRERQLLVDTQELAVGAVGAPVPTVCGPFDWSFKQNVWVMLAAAIGQNTLCLPLITLQLPTLLRENADSNCNSLMKYIGLLVTSERCSLDKMQLLIRMKCCNNVCIQLSLSSNIKN